VLDPADTPRLERYLITVLRAHPSLTWASYGDRDGRFVGAWRDPTGMTYLNRSFPRGTRIRLEEDGYSTTDAARPCASPTTITTSRRSSPSSALRRLAGTWLEFEAGPAFPDDALDVKRLIQFPRGPTREGSYARADTRHRVATTSPATIRESAVFTALSERDRARIAAIGGDRDNTFKTA